MPDFDPKAFIREAEAAAAASPEFDPKKFIADSSEGTEQGLRAKYRQEIEKRGEPGQGERAIDNLTFGGARPLSGIVRAVEGLRDPNSTIGQRYRAGNAAAADYFDKAVTNTPGALGVANDVGSAVATGLVGRGVGLGKQVGQAAIQGAVEGANKNSQDLWSAVKGGVRGAATGAGTTFVVGGLLDRLSSGAKRLIGEASRGGTSVTEKTAAGAILDTLDNAGIYFSGKQTPELANKANSVLANSAYSTNVPSSIEKVMAELNQRVKDGAMTYGDIRKIQTQLSDLKGGDDAVVARLAGQIDDAVMDFMGTARANIPLSSQGKVSIDDLEKARELYSRGSKARTVEGMEEVAARTKDPTKTMQEEVKNYTDPMIRGDKPTTLSPEQMNIADSIVKGGPRALETTEKATDKLSKYLATTSVLGGAGALAAPMLGIDGEKSGGAQALSLTGLAAAGLLKGGNLMARQKLAEIAAGKTDDLLRNIITGSTAQAPNAYVPRNALAKTMIAPQVGRTAGNYLSNVLTGGEQ